mmetsp:Transcript_24824/g.57848  ORF Transcript_24824/g.57848 Transcript_24824/m.57848 type:complete len:101 (+) Transcript_24824:2-304(+)
MTRNVGIPENKKEQEEPSRQDTNTQHPLSVRVMEHVRDLVTVMMKPPQVMILSDESPPEMPRLLDNSPMYPVVKGVEALVRIAFHHFSRPHHHGRRHRFW